MKRSFLQTAWIYQKERFPVLVHIPLISAFSFSAIAYSRACRDATGFIDWQDYLFCILTNTIVFFILRVSDEYKDKEDDAMYRSYLPVPRGLVTLKELALVAVVLATVATAVNIFFFPSLLGMYSLMIGYLLLMRYEFFIPSWLKRHQVAYIASHMVIIPLADIYASGYDWKLAGVQPPGGLVFFFMVSFLNGIVLEIGRKIRVDKTEEPGVTSYTKLWGIRGAPTIWIAILTANFIIACLAARYAGYSVETYYALGTVYFITLLPAILFLYNPTRALTKFIEGVSLLWALGMYLVLGGIPLLLKLIGIGS